MRPLWDLDTGGTAAEHARADWRCGRAWSCMCGACRVVRPKSKRTARYRMDVVVRFDESGPRFSFAACLSPADARRLVSQAIADGAAEGIALFAGPAGGVYFTQHAPR